GVCRRCTGFAVGLSEANGQQRVHWVCSGGKAFYSTSLSYIMIDKELLDILACPACKGDIELKGEKLVCLSCKRRYPIRDGIPVMLIEEAEFPEKE
ncbi:MAG: Trm112 family protein, partial [Candidatus Methanofastidiosia archaeon]